MKMESREMILANTGSHSKNKKECLDLFPEKKTPFFLQHPLLFSCRRCGVQLQINRQRILWTFLFQAVGGGNFASFWIISGIFFFLCGLPTGFLHHGKGHSETIRRRHMSLHEIST